MDYQMTANLKEWSASLEPKRPGAPEPAEGASARKKFSFQNGVQNIFPSFIQMELESIIP